MDKAQVPTIIRNRAGQDFRYKASSTHKLYIGFISIWYGIDTGSLYGIRFCILITKTLDQVSWSNPVSIPHQSIFFYHCLIFMNMDKEIKHIKRNIMISYLAIHVILLGHQCVLFLFMSHQAELTTTRGRSKISWHSAYILIKTYM